MSLRECSELRSAGLICFTLMICVLLFQYSLPTTNAISVGPVSYEIQAILSNVNSDTLLYTYANAAYLDSGANITRVSVITATPRVTTVNATAITTAISATTAAVSVSVTGGEQDFHLEAALVIVIAIILGVIVFARKKRTTEQS